MCRCPALVQSESKELYIHDMEYAVFLAFIQYLYTDAVTSNDKNLIQKLSKCAERYENVRLKKICIDLTTNIDVTIPPSTFKEDLSKVRNVVTN